MEAPAIWRREQASKVDRVETMRRLVRLVLIVAIVWPLANPPSVHGQEDGVVRAPNPVIAIVATGGTITSTRGGQVPIEQVIADIRDRYPEARELLDRVTFEVTAPFRGSSRALSSADFLKIARVVNRAAEDPRVVGVIVTHGTTTSEETAYFLHLLVKTRKPIVLTNSQRRHLAAGNDGERNFLDAVAVALAPEAAGKGSLVVENQTISSGRDVYKSSGRPGSFTSGIHGALGVVDADSVTFYRAPTRRHTIQSEFDLDRIAELPKVEVISVYFDADPGLIQAAVDLGVDGIVLNGFTPGGGPFGTQTAILRSLRDRGFPIVRTARGGIDNRVPIVADGGSWFISGDNLSFNKARILLQLALTRTSDVKEIERIFREY